MPDVVVRVSERLWPAWLAEGDLPGQPWSGREHALTVAAVPRIEPGERVYVAMGGIVRGYAPLERMECDRMPGRGFSFARLIRHGDARAMKPMCVTPERCSCPIAWRGPHPRYVTGSGQFLYRSWEYNDEWALADWRTRRGYYLREKR
jgi:hypothetical protein